MRFHVCLCGEKKYGDSDRRRACVCASVCVASVHARVMSKWWLHKKLNLRRRRRRGPFISPGERVLSPPPSLPPTGRSRDNNNSVLRTSLEKRTVFAIYSVNNRFRREFCSSQFFFSFLSIFHVLKTHLVYFRYVSFRIINYDYVIDRFYEIIRTGAQFRGWWLNISNNWLWKICPIICRYSNNDS